jgi:hypothetical protein
MDENSEVPDGVFVKEAREQVGEAPAVQIGGDTKRIRWRLRSPSGYGRNTDVAPNGGGWYG